ncbi:NDR1/HIN1-like protein 12 [Tasmannia lanceolata]|uniref:NDR1/HIN1-like protein 12 n=1 Tax=Tasmannia lanceolata TaxID=3420 RepID=UPI004064B63B
MAEENQPQADKKEMTQNKPMASRYKPHHILRFFCTCIFIFLLLVAITALVLWLLYKPSKPHFNVVGAAIYKMNTTSQNVISTTMQFTIITRNPNKRVSVHYDHLSSFVSYRNHAITPEIPLPPLSQGSDITVVMSPVLGGGCMPVPPEVASGLLMEQNYGVVRLSLVLLGRLRWKAGAFRSRRYEMYMKCDMLVGLKDGVVGQVPLIGSPHCTVDI